MKMIDVMKRLAELDATNPNIVKENADLAECGMMDAMSGMGQSHTPASVNITAGSGEELSNMLKDIMSLAGVHRVEPGHLGAEPEPMALTAEPVAAVGPMASAGDEMRSVIDKLNLDTDGEEEMGDEAGEEETDEGQYDNSPHSARDVPSFKHDAMLNKDMQNQDQSGPPGQGDRFDGKNPKAFPTFESQLMAEYKTFISEGTQEVGQMMANDGITYSPEREDEIINKMAEYMKSAGMGSKQIRYLLNQEDYIPDQLSYLPRDKNQGTMDEVVDLTKNPNSDPGADARVAAFKAKTQGNPTVKIKLPPRPAK